MKINRLHRNFISMLLPVVWCVPLLAQDAGPLAATPPATSELEPAKPPRPTPPPAAPAAVQTTAAETKAPARIEVPTGTHIPLVLHNGISTRSARPGDPVYFETLFPVMVDGRVAIPAGTYISGEVTESKRPGRVKGRAELGVKFTTMILPNAYMVNLNASPGGAAGTGGGETMDKEGKISGDSDKASDIGTIAKTTGAGAGIGAAAGIAAVLMSRGPEAELPRGSTLDAVINRPILLDADKAQFTGPGQASTLPGPPNREPQRNRMPF
jgi:type IV secretion system protein VirB10